MTPSLQNAITHAITTELMAVAPLYYTLVAPDAATADSSFAMAACSPMTELAIRPAARLLSGPASSAAAMPGSTSTRTRFDDVQVGDSAYWVVLHELGHTLGLKHGHANDRPGPIPDPTVAARRTSTRSSSR